MTFNNNPRQARRGLSLELDDVGLERRGLGGDGSLARHNHHTLAEEGLALG